MNITFLTLAGIENSTTKRVFYIANELKKRGHKINFLSLNWIAKKGSSCNGDIFFEGIKIKEVKLKDNIFNVFFLGPIKLLMKLKGDLVILSKPLPPHTIPFLLANFVLRKKFVLDSDDWEGVGGGASYSNFGWFKRSLITFLEEYVGKKAKGVIVASKVLEKRNRDMGVKRVVYAPNVSDSGNFNVNEESKDKLKKEFGIKNERVFLSSGSHDMEMLVDGLKFFIEGFSKVNGNFKLIILGNGKYTQELKNLCKKLGDKVIFPGFLQKERFNTCVAIADAAIVSTSAKYPYTLYALSSSPRKMYEAMAAGLVILGSPLGEIKETLGNSENFLVQEGNVESLVKNIDYIIEIDRNKLKKIGIENKKKIEEIYNFKTQGENIEYFLNEI